MKFPQSSFLAVAGLSFFGLSPLLLAQEAGSTLKPNDRILFIGDSITGNGMNHGPESWALLIRKSLAEAYPDSQFTTVSLGGSGMTLFAWTGTLKKENPGTLDIKEFPVKENLDQPSDVIVIMLGMNDILSPSGPPNEERYTKWEEAYRELIQGLKARVKPRVVALAMPTLCTEDLESAKNQEMRKLHERIKKLAESENAVVLPTFDAMAEIRATGEQYRPDFRVTGDGVHPNRYGHYAIAAGMLEGLGEKTLSQKLREKAKELIVGREKAPISWILRRTSNPADLTATEDRFTLTWYTPEGKEPLKRGEAPSLTLPEGWKVISQKQEETSGVFEIQGPLDRLRNHFTLSANGRQASFFIPAPWLVGYTKADRVPTKGWFRGEFKPEEAPLPVDASILSGKKLGEPIEVFPGIPLTWNRYVANPLLSTRYGEGSIDFDALYFYTQFSLAYGARWIYSEKEEPVKFGVERLGFAGVNHLRLELNGQVIYDARPGTRGTTTEPVTLKKGWNLLSFKSNYSSWQWKFAIDLLPVEGSPDSLDQLRVSVVKPQE